MHVQFVATPFLPRNIPSLGISSLIAKVRAGGYHASAHYLNLDLAKYIGSDLSIFAEQFFESDTLVGEVVFTRALWGDAAISWENYEPVLKNAIKSRAESFRSDEIDKLLTKCKSLMEEAPQIINRWAERLICEKPDIVALSTTFQQNVASLALAKRIKERTGFPSPLIIMGGANCEGEMGEALAENFPFIDTVVSGEGEGVILDLIKARRMGEKPKKHIRGNAIKNMDSLPIPDFSDYFRNVEGDPGINQVRLVAEASRGCWWGAKSHCTFCGFNGTTMPYRAKTAQRFIDELRLLRSTYKHATVLITDNIFDMNYFKTVLPVLAEDAEGFKFNCEVKANLRKDQIDLMAMAGAVWIQAGIESLSSDVLHSIKKGSTFLQNVQTLKWCQEAGVYAIWSFIYGFPGENEQAYDEMLEIIPALAHLYAPHGNSQVQLHRFSPYWNAPEQYGIANITHAAGYDFAYPVLPASERKRLAYSFDFEYLDGKTVKRYFKPLEAAIASWRHENRNGATLRFDALEGRTAIVDTRGGKKRPAVWVSDTEERLLHAFDRKVSIAQACESVLRDIPSASNSEMQEAVAKMQEEKWIIEENKICISLVLDFSRQKDVRKNQLIRAKNRTL